MHMNSHGNMTHNTLKKYNIRLRGGQLGWDRRLALHYRAQENCRFTFARFAQCFHYSGVVYFAVLSMHFMGSSALLVVSQLQSQAVLVPCGLLGCCQASLLASCSRCLRFQLPVELAWAAFLHTVLLALPECILEPF